MQVPRYQPRHNAPPLRQPPPPLYHQRPPPPVSHINPPPAPPAPVPAIVPTAPFNASPTLLPGPFIILILLPAIPLLLFSLGARPPDTSNLPFAANDMWLTMGFVTIAGIVVLCLGVYPEVGGTVWDWIKAGGEGVVVGRGNDSPGVGPAAGIEGREGGVVWNQRLGKWVRGPSLVASRQAAEMAARARISNTRGIHSLASKHLTALRSSPMFNKWYDPSKPPLVHSIFLICIILFLSYHILSHTLGKIYDIDSSSSSSSTRPSSGSSSSGSGGKDGKSSSSSSGSGSGKLPTWVERELRKRKEEKPADTLKRVREETKKEEDKFKKGGDKEGLKKFKEKREKEKDVLKKELGKRKMDFVGLEGDKKGKDKDKDKSKDKKKDKGGDKDNGTKDGAGTKLAKILTSSRGKKENTKDQTASGQGVTWELADPGVAQATLANSGMNAQREAERLKASGSG
ncbi:hypothetical protein CI109_107259 [Kwoniella shandongensis]|uniref:Uncharacterized protein n=1 Tax=Kwoniella shandongensis TaxID=1734106 RepID=A0A5M6C3F1_9TREE|nr:uncharacterized protein CI109_002541 [Kwoniella shandongensis]KAA5529200.1 hypothetical protein CI109_002541 [Kwoniella shandongensis]